MMKRQNRPNRYFLKAIHENETLVLSDDHRFHEDTARPKYFKQARQAASFWNSNAPLIELDAKYKVVVQGPRGGSYEIHEALSY